MHHVPTAAGVATCVLAITSLAGGLAGCRLIKTTAEIPGNAVRAITPGSKEDKGEVQANPVALQQDIFRFCDEYSNIISAEYDRLIEDRPGVATSGLVRTKLHLNYRMIEIASGANEYVNLCDLVCLVVLSRYTFENHWMPVVLHESGEPTLKKLVEFERQIIELAGASLGDAAQEKLRTSIAAWVETSSEPGMALLTRYRGLSAEVVQSSEAAEDEKSTLLGALMIDPLAGLDPTVREIAQTRLFAERAMFVAQRMPKILRMEAELVGHQLTESPQASRLLAELGRVTESADRMSRVVEGFPALIQSEREALLKALDEQSPELTRLMAETRATVEASTQAMAATNTVVQTTDRFLERLGVYEKPSGDAAAAADKSPGEPFRIQDYTTAAAQLGASAEQLNGLILSLERTLATATSPGVADKVTAASQAATARGRELIDHVFRRVLSLIIVIGILTPIVVFVCRRLGHRTGETSKP